MHFIGHQKNRELLQHLVDQRQLPHALIFTGPSGIGKKLVALHLVQRLFCEARNQKPETGNSGLRPSASGLDPFPCENCSACQRVAKLQHPDLLWVEPEKGLIKIESVRSLKSSLALKPFEAPLKVVILVDAHALNPAASNALLKTLEEPPANTLLVLTTSSPHQLLKTILSRCQILYFSPLTRKETLEVLKNSEKGIAPEITEFAMGSPGLALSLKPEACDLTLRKVLPALNSQPKDLLALFSAAEEIVDDDSYAEPVLHLLRMKWREKLIAEPSQENLRKMDAIEAASRALNHYANPLLTFENLFLNLCL
jgi:DNA polymerase-3 subunit delta'